MKHRRQTDRLGDQLGEYADTRIRFEADAMLVIDALEQHLDHGLDRELLAAVAQRAAKSRDQMLRQESRSGLRIDRDAHPRSLVDLITAAAEGSSEEGAADEPQPHPACCGICGILVPSFDTECANGHGVQS
jgi:hypothetical protein